MQKSEKKVGKSLEGKKKGVPLQSRSGSRTREWKKIIEKPAKPKDMKGVSVFSGTAVEDGKRSLKRLKGKYKQVPRT